MENGRRRDVFFFLILFGRYGSLFPNAGFLYQSIGVSAPTMPLYNPLEIQSKIGYVHCAPRMSTGLFNNEMTKLYIR